MKRYMEKKTKFWGYTIASVLLIFLGGCMPDSQSTNAPKHIIYRYAFPNYSTHYHPGNTITLTWKAFPTNFQADKEDGFILKAAFTQNAGTYGDLSKPIIINTTDWTNKTYTMTFHIPRNTPPQTYELVTSISASASANRAVGKGWITIEK